MLLLFGSLKDTLDFVSQSACANQKESHAAALGKHRNRISQRQHPMPGAKGAYETRQCFLFRNSKFLTDGGAPDTGSKLFDIYSIWIHYDLVRRYAGLEQIIPFHVGDDENTGGSSEIESFASFEQIRQAHAPPVFRHPDFRTVVFQQQRPARAQAGLDTGPIEATVALINKVWRLPGNLGARSCGKKQTIAQTKTRTGQP